ncbi:Kelch repeat-containing protein [Colletotrichum sidae]|uniref:Kelch repeat-containing protein n=1 Tax=Colletotrichum sidae TaxID=1347389 RepID=A0A4R8TCD9_9PEZI|nr:Kelch repeat-containing protein [Colletotrichum sidae]
MRPLATARGVRNIRGTTTNPAAAACHFYTTAQAQEPRLRRRPRVHVKKKPPKPDPPRSWRSFEMPNVVLDLDSWESSYTRPYDSEDHKVQRQKWAVDPRKDAMWKRVSAFESNFKEAKGDFIVNQGSNSWHPWQVTDLDVMTAALQGAPEAPSQDTPKSSYSAQQYVAYKNAIPPSVFRDDQRLLEWLLHRYPRTSQQPPVARGLSNVIGKQTTFRDIYRLISGLLNSQEGKINVLRKTDKLAAVMSELLDSRAASPAVVLPVLNSFFMQDVGSATRLSGTRSKMLMLLAVSAGLSVLPAAAQQDPLNNFCRRFGHQTAVVDSKLYIDGGLINWNMIESPSNYSNPYLLYQDLSTSAPNVGMPPLYANLSKNGTVPYTNGGALWADGVNKRLYLFGGEHNAEPPSPFNLWAYDILNNQWDSFGQPRSGVVIQKVSYGAGVSVDSRGEAYYYGGWLSNASIPGWGATPPVATNGLVKYTMDTNSWSNNTGPDNVRRAEGSLHYIPAGGGGMLVYFGGIQDLNANGTVEGQPMDQIFMYDILSSRWYTQTAVGQVPDMRRRFCAGVTWAEDQSSYNIYMYGGANVPGVLGAGFDDVYVLSVPTFTWVKMYPATNGTGSNPHHSLSCNIVPGRAQMIIIGGTFPSSNECDYPVQWGTHNVDLGKQNKNKSIWELYSPNKTAYSVPDDIVAIVGGNGNGGATKTSPSAGWNMNDLGILITQQAEISARAPTRAVTSATSTPSDGLSTGAIVGIAVGAGAVVIALAIACGCLIRKRRAQRYRNPAMTPHPSGGHFNPNNMSEAWSPPTTTTHLTPVTSPYSPPYGHSPYTPPPVSPVPQPVPQHGSFPIELPSDSRLAPAALSPPPPQNHSVSPPSTAAAAPPPLPHVNSSSTYPPQHNYFPEQVTLSNQVQIDANGNMWVPQVSMVQIGPGSQPGSHNGTPPVYTPPPSNGDRKMFPQVEVQPAPLPAELPSAPQELSAEEPGDRGDRASRHKTYYNR